jgi:hypothetical protein
VSRDPFPRDADESLHLIANALEDLERALMANRAEVDPPRPAIGWAILELLGHRREVGYLDEWNVAGVRFLRLETPVFNEEGLEHKPGRVVLFSTAAIYAITPSTERAVHDEIAPWVDCGEPVAVQVEGSDEPQPQPCSLRRGHDGEHDPDLLADLPF